MDEKTSSLIQGYLDKAGEKLRVAEELLELKHYDDTVSRAYYSAFHAAQAALLTEGLTATQEVFSSPSDLGGPYRLSPSPPT